DRPDSDGRPGRDEHEIREWAREHDLPYFDGQVHFPDYRIDYEVDGRELQQDVELFTSHYRGAHAASRAKTGFRIYLVGSRGNGGASGPHPRGRERFLCNTNTRQTGRSTVSASPVSARSASTAGPSGSA